MMRTLALAVSLALLAAAPAVGSGPDPDWSSGVRTPAQASRFGAGVVARRGAARDPQRILTRGAVFDPLVGLPALDRGRGFRRPEGPPGADLPVLVQLRDVPDAAARAWLEGLRAEVLRAVPNRALLIRLPGPDLGTLRRDPRVRWADVLRPDLKLAPELLVDTFEGPFFLEALVLRGGDPARAVAGAIQEAPTAAPVARFEDGSGGVLLRVRVDGSELARAAVALANDPWVEAVEVWELPAEHNDHSIYIIQSYDLVHRLTYSMSATVWNQGIVGTGQIVAVSDTRFDSDMCFFNTVPGVHPAPSSPVPPDPGPLDPAAKVVGHVLVGLATADGTSNHGTHVAGSVAGDNLFTLSTPTSGGHDTADGMAPQAQLFLQGLSSASSTLVGASGDPYALSLQAWNAGARIQTNSWGAQVGGGAAPYDYMSQSKDRFTWDHEEFLHIYSAGNVGAGLQYVARPANSKNVIAVAAATHGSVDSAGIASFSAEGPALDGRIKPDIAAPGESINSARSNAVQGDGNCFTTVISGTSMAAPTMAGAAALVRQYFADGFYPGGAASPADAFEPSAALVKAALINGADDTGTANIPEDVKEGWGRIHLDDALFFAGDPEGLRVRDRRNAQGLRTGDEDVLTVDAGAGGPLQVTLVWSDPPSPLLAATNLVNDLDLEVSGPGGTRRGNVFAAGESTTGGAADALNNVEQVLIKAPVAGTYTVRVKATAVPGNGFTPGSQRQGYALVVTQAACASAVGAPPTGLAALDQGGAGVDLSWDPGAPGYEILRAEGTCGAPDGSFTFIGSTSGASFTDPDVEGGRSYAYQVRPADDCGVGAAACVAVVSSADCTAPPSFAGVGSASSTPATAACDVELSWSPAVSRCPAAPTVTYNVYRGTTPGFTPGPGQRIATGVAGTSYVDQAAGALESLHYVVRAEDGTGAGGGPANGGNEDANTVSLAASGSSPAPGAVFEDDGGDTAAQLLLEPPWTLSSQQNHTAGGTFSYRTGPDGEPLYRSGVCAAATTPSIELGQGTPELSYWARYNLEFGWDGVVVEISTDDGATWADLPPDDVAGSVARYPSYMQGHGACGFPRFRRAINNPNNHLGLSPWFAFTHELAAYAGRRVSIRWVMTSDSFVEYEGLHLDDIRITGTEAPAGCGPRGEVRFDAAAAACSGSVGLTVSDTGLAGDGSIAVQVASDTEPTPETVLLSESGPGTGIFTGSMATSSLPPVGADGILAVTHGDVLTVEYADADDGGGGAAVARDRVPVDCQGPSIRNVRAVDVTHDGATILWETDEWTDGLVRVGAAPPPAGSVADPTIAPAHAVRLSGLAPCTPYVFSVESTDDAGNTAVDDNGGAYFAFETAMDPEISVSSTDTPLAIPDADAVTGISSVIPLADPRALMDLDVEVDVTHASDFELTLTLIAPDTTSVTLADNKGLILGQDMIDTVFDDQALTGLADGTPPYSARFKPDDPLSAVSGLAAAGSWTLHVTDDLNIPPVPANTGQLDSWTLHATLVPTWCAAHASSLGHAAVSDTCTSGGAGNGNGFWDPGEQVQFAMTLHNDGPVDLTGVTATVTPLNTGVFMPDPSASFGTVPPQTSAASMAPHFTAQLPTSLDCDEVVEFLLDVSAAEGSWSAFFSGVVGDGGFPACTVQRCNEPLPVPDGTFGTAMTVVPSGPAALDVSWDVAACASPDYQILFGDLAGVSSLSPAGAVCGLGTSGAATWSGVPAGDLWFLVVGASGNGTEATWGLAADGSHRGGIAASGLCGNQARDNNRSCP